MVIEPQLYVTYAHQILSSFEFFFFVNSRVSACRHTPSVIEPVTAIKSGKFNLFLSY